jgi:ABC-type multidrug transport system fused ATPase/permease subunit
MGLRMYEAGAMSLASIYLIFLYTQQMMQPLDEMTYQIQDYQAAVACAGRMQALLDLPLPPVPERPLPLPAGPLTVELDHVAFRYSPEASLILRDITFTVPAGRTLGIVGRTGSGKSTLIRLMAGLYPATAGSVLLGGVDLTRAAPASVRGRVVLVSQEVQLFHASIRDNVTVFDPTVPDAAVEAAFARLGLATWLAGLPDGLDTVLGRDGFGLSAGEEQMLTLVRANLADPGLVLLDEASARLDRVTERVLDRAVHGMLRGRTGVVIAHRLSTLERVDDILVMADGEIVEHGPRAQLAADPGSQFRALLDLAMQEAR